MTRIKRVVAETGVKDLLGHLYRAVIRLGGT
jgi:hypothetical protein